jgi:hypothetical protein
VLTRLQSDTFAELVNEICPKPERTNLRSIFRVPLIDLDLVGVISIRHVRAVAVDFLVVSSNFRMLH